jgi:sodium transport system permease protein
VRPPFVFAVAAREILSTLRDRRAVLANLLIPLIVLLLVILGLPLLLGGLFGREAVTQSEVGAEGLGRLPAALVRALEEENITLLEVPDAEAAVRSERVAAALAVPPGFAARLRAGSAPLTLYRKSGGLRDELVTEKLTGALETFEETLVRQRLRRAGLEPQLLTPITLTTRDASSPAERAGGSLGWLIPFFIVVWTLTGGQMVAIDATAGEKERGTLEALLVTPVRRAEVVVGKFLATLLFGLSAALMAVVGFLASGGLLGLLFAGRLSTEAGELASSLGRSLSIGVGEALALLLSSLLLAVLVAALLIAVTLFARSLKEAQSYVAPLSLVLVLPVVGLQFADFFAHPALYALPAFGTLLLMNDLVQGTFELRSALWAWGSSLALAALLLGFALRNFRRESVLFRT